MFKKGVKSYLYKNFQNISIKIILNLQLVLRI
jgi:hypothetical protein